MEAKVRISYGTNEVEIEGSEVFVREQLDNLDSLLGLFAPNDDFGDEGHETPTPDSMPDTPKSTSGMPETFGEYLNQFKKAINQEEQMLIAGYFVQKKSADNGYSTKEANDLLKEQGIKVGNAAQAVTVAKNAKRVFAVQRGKFRVSQPGVDHINTLRNS
jgi:hypothetical protein